MKRRANSKSTRLARTGSKAVTFSPAGVTWNFRPAGTRFNYAGEVGDGLGSSVLVSLLCWLMRTFPEAPCVVERYDAEQEQWGAIFRHPMAEQIRRPNPYYSGRVLWMSTVMDFAFGNAYWLKVRDSFDDLKELWWVPAALIRPKKINPQDGKTFIDYYEYDINGQQKKLSPDDVVHFRFGNHPENPRLGYTPLAAMVREIYVDDQASNFTASVLRNLGIAGIVVSPETGGPNIPEGKLPLVKDYLQQNFTADKRGQGLVFSSPTKVQLLQYNLQGFDMGPIRDIAEERLSAVFGIPAAVVGFGTGLQQTKVGATMKELKALAWDGCLIPMGTIIAEELDRALLPEFQNNPGLFRSQFDYSNVRALREDAKEKSDRLATLGEKGFISVAEVRKGAGFTAGPEHEVYYRPTTVEAVAKPNAPAQASQVRVTEQAPPGSAPSSPSAGKGVGAKGWVTIEGHHVLIGEGGEGGGGGGSSGSHAGARLDESRSRAGLQSANGYFDPHDGPHGTIRVAADLDPVDRPYVLSHETGHAYDWNTLGQSKGYWSSGSAEFGDALAADRAAHQSAANSSDAHTAAHGLAGLEYQDVLHKMGYDAGEQRRELFADAYAAAHGQNVRSGIYSAKEFQNMFPAVMAVVRRKVGQ